MTLLNDLNSNSDCFPPSLLSSFRFIYNFSLFSIMGCDGGTIPKRDEMVKLKKKAEKVSIVLHNVILNIISL